MFHIGDKIVHPMHGQGCENIVQKELDNEVQSFYVLNMPLAGMVIMVPIKSCKGIGVRKVIDSKQADELMHQLEDIDVDMNQNWNRRYRENMSLIKSGNPVDVARVVKGLMMRNAIRGFQQVRERCFILQSRF